METYRAYVFGPDGQPATVVELHCANDADAVASAAQLDGRVIELYQGSRHIAKLEQN
jgi:hypothetical protein